MNDSQKYQKETFVQTVPRKRLCLQLKGTTYLCPISWDIMPAVWNPT